MFLEDYYVSIRNKTKSTVWKQCLIYIELDNGSEFISNEFKQLMKDYNYVNI